MIRITAIVLLLHVVNSLSAQFYTNASNQLPNDGAKKQSMDIRAADLDADGDMDIVLANEFQANTILLNDGSGNFSTAIDALPVRIQDSEDVAIADFNGDGWLDLVFCSEDDVVLGEQNVHEYYLGSASGIFSAGPDNLVDSEANAVISVDVNADGWADLLFGNDGPTSLLINDQTGSFNLDEERIPAINRTTQDLLMVDLTGDGHPDLIEGNENGNLYFVNDGNGFFTNETAERFPVFSNLETRKVVSGDVDADGDLDLFLCNVAFLPGRNPQNRLLINDGNGNFSDATPTQLPDDLDFTLDALIIDLDNDLDADILTANFGGSPQRVYRNDGNGNFTFATIDILGENYIREGLGLFSADFNGDALIDIYLCDRKVPSTNNKDLLLLKAPLTDVDEAHSRAQIMVYPNPIQDTIYLKGLTNSSRYATLTDTSGRILSQLQLQKYQEASWRAIWPPHLLAGSYIINVGGRAVKVIKE